MWDVIVISFFCFFCISHNSLISVFETDGNHCEPNQGCCVEPSNGFSCECTSARPLSVKLQHSLIILCDKCALEIPSSSVFIQFTSSQSFSQQQESNHSQASDLIVSHICFAKLTTFQLTHVIYQHSIHYELFVNFMYQQLFTEHCSYFFSFTPLFIDGSKSDDDVGSAFICMDEIFAEWITNPSVTLVFTVELHAIHHAL